ncbi:MAG: substrate-binding periplasmic protein [Bosea sp. (in: a-proteobacteria)]
MTTGFQPTRRLMGAMAIAMAALGFAPTAQAQSAGPGIEEIIKRGELIVAVQTQGPPVSFVNAKGERVGFVIDIVKAMAADMGVKLTMQDYDFRGLIPAAISGKVDFIAADMAPTPQRALQLSFSNEFYAEPAMLYAKRAKGFKSVTDLNKQGLSIAVAQGSSNKLILEREFPLATIREFAGGGPALAEAANADRADAVINTRSNARSNMLSYGDTFELLPEEIYLWPEAFGVRPEKTHLISWMNNWLYWAKRDGKLDRWADYWRRGDTWRKDHM